MPARLFFFARGAALVLVLSAIPLVHGLSAAATAQSKPRAKDVAKPREAARDVGVVLYGTAKLPGPVAEMREAILSAVRSGLIEDLRFAIELNEIKPDFGADPGVDAIAHLKTLSGDGEGREILAALGEILDGGYLVLPLSKDIENNRVYVWPYFAELTPEALTAAQQVELLRLVPVEAANIMKSQRRYTGWRLTIGADGTWHSFGKAR